MHFVYIVPRFHTNLFFATKALVEAGHRVTILCPARAPLEDYTYVTPRVLTEADLSFTAVHRLLRDLQPDLVVLRHVSGRWKRFLWLALALRLKIVGYDLRPASLARSTLKQATGLLRGKPLRRISPVPDLNRPGDFTQPQFIPFPVEPAVDAEQRHYMPDGTLRILCIAKLNQQRKRHFDLIEAARQLAQPLCLTFVGMSSVDAVSGASDTYQAKLLAMAGTHGQLTIDILPDQDFAAMTALYRHHDICVLPAAHEPLGVAPLEAIAAGTVPVATDQCGCAGYFTQAQNGYVYPVGNVVALTAILRDLTDAPHLQQVGCGAACLAATELSMLRYVDRMERTAKDTAWA